jgi:hypothetical protein
LGVIACFGLILTLETGTARASIFPNNTIGAFVEVSDSGGTACPNILTATDHERTILYGTIRTTGANTGKMLADSFVYLNNQNNTIAESFAPYILPAQATLTCERANNKPFSFRIAYVDYNLATAITPSEIVGTIQVASTSHDLLLSKTASGSSLPLTTYGTMTAGDILIALLLFGLIMLNLLTIFLRKI